MDLQNRIGFNLRKIYFDFVSGKFNDFKETKTNESIDVHYNHTIELNDEALVDNLI